MKSAIQDSYGTLLRLTPHVESESRPTFKPLYQRFHPLIHYVIMRYTLEYHPYMIRTRHANF